MGWRFEWASSGDGEFNRDFKVSFSENHYLDLAPEGRNHAAHPNWPRRRDEYDLAGPPHG